MKNTLVILFGCCLIAVLCMARITILERAITSSFRSLARVGAHCLTAQDSSGATVRVLMTPLPPIDCEMLLGPDIREASIARAERETAPAIPNQSIWADESGNEWKLVKRVDNPNSILIDYYFVKITDKDAQ